MPSRWWVPLDGLASPSVSLTHVHAAFSRWFDETGPEHHFGDKPYALSPVGGTDTAVGVEIGTLSDEADRRLLKAAEQAPKLTLGRQRAVAGPPVLVSRDSWPELAAYDGATRWRLDFVSPVTFRSGDRSSPAPHAATILSGLRRAWMAWSDHPLPADAEVSAAAYISDLDLASEVLTFALRSQGRNAKTVVTISAATGHVVLRATRPDAAPAVNALLRLAAYSGVGSMTRKGLGVTRVSGHGSAG